MMGDSNFPGETGSLINRPVTIRTIARTYLLGEWIASLQNARRIHGLTTGKSNLASREPLSRDLRGEKITDQRIHQRGFFVDHPVRAIGNAFDA